MVSTFNVLPRTSRSHPLQIAEISVGEGLGRLGATFAPGKKQWHAATRYWDRDLETDLDPVAAWNAAVVVSLIEGHEIQDLQKRQARPRGGPAAYGMASLADPRL
jgi:hypothetical protein